MQSQMGLNKQKFQRGSNTSKINKASKLFLYLINQHTSRAQQDRHGWLNRDYYKKAPQILNKPSELIAESTQTIIQIEKKKVMGLLAMIKKVIYTSTIKHG